MDDFWKCTRLILFALALTLEVETTEGKSRDDVLRNDLKHFNTNRHHVINPQGKMKARIYIERTFVSLGLHTWKEVFQTESKGVKGINVVGVLPGKWYQTKNDMLMLIGAHYDSFRMSRGANDNGSGVVAMLEIARQLSKMTSGRCTRQFSVIFVGFDFEEWEKVPNSACRQVGCGSRAFVANFTKYYRSAVHVLNRESASNFGRLQGAIIMDTIMNYNSKKHSQKVPENLRQYFVSQYKTIARDHFRGNFIAAVGRYPVDSVLLNNLFYYYNLFYQGPHPSKYKLLRFFLGFGGQPESLDENMQKALSPFFRSDHINFWNGITSNAAIFLSDTANMRSYMVNCYHKNCDDMDQLPKDFGFLVKSCDAIVKTINDFTESDCKPTPPAESSDAEGLLGALISVCVILFATANAFAIFIYHRFCKKNHEDPVLVDQDHLAVNSLAEAPQPEHRGEAQTKA